MLIIAGVVLASGIFIILMIGNAFNSTCGDGWQQRRLDEVLKNQSTNIEKAEAAVQSVQLVENHADFPAQRNENKASGDCLDGSPASVTFYKKVTVTNASMRSTEEFISKSLINKGFQLSEWQIFSGRCQPIVSVTAVRNGALVNIRIEGQSSADCDPIHTSSDEMMWDMPAGRAEVSSEVTSLGFRS